MNSCLKSRRNVILRNVHVMSICIQSERLIFNGFIICVSLVYRLTSVMN